MKKKFNEIFTGFMNKTIRYLLFFILIADLVAIGVTIVGGNKSTIVFLLIAAIAIWIGYILFKIDIYLHKRLIIILFIGLALRILWMLNIPSAPVSDFKLMYDSASQFLNGDRSMFYGTSYMARFPHLTITVLYMALMKFLFPINNILAMKTINLILGLLDIVLIYLLADLIFENKIYAQIAAFISAVFPAHITYTNVICSENIAIPFYMLSIYLFINYFKNHNGNIQLILCGISLSVGNLFRTIAAVIIIAYCMYIIIYTEDFWKKRVKNVFIVITSYFLIMVIVSTTLQNISIIETPLWVSKEPKITSILKGSNYKSFGKWNQEDADFIDKHLENYNELQEECCEIIIDRFKSNSIFRTVIFLLGKFALQWVVGDYEGSIWSQLDVSERDIRFPVKNEGSLAFQLIYTSVLVLIFIGLKNKNILKKVKEVNLLYLILGGYGITYMITEEQGRYSYICWYVIILLSIAGLDSLSGKVSR